MHLSTEEPAASRMLEPLVEVGGDVPESRDKMAGTVVFLFTGGHYFQTMLF